MNPPSTHRMSWYLLIVISALTAFVYSPSLFHTTRSDISIFIANTAGINRLGELLNYSYAINRNPQLILGGEEALFRPLTFALWGAERYFFGLDFFGWQLVGIILHLLVVWRLYQLLMLIRPGVTAAVTTGVFSLLLANIEGVIWNTVFISQCLLMLIALETCLTRHLNPRSTTRALWIHAASMSAACLIYEFPLALSAVFFLFFLSRKNEPNRAAWLVASLAPCGVYLTASIGHLILSGYSPLALLKPSHYDPFKTAIDLLLSVKWFFVLGTTLIPKDLFPADRLSVPYSYAVSLWPFDRLSLMRLPGLLFLGCTLALPVWSFFHRPSQPERPVRSEARLLSIAFLLAYVLLLTVSRAHVSTVKIYANHLYYAYIFWLFWLIFCFSSINLDNIPDTKPNRVALFLLNAILAVFVVSNAISLFQVNRMVKNAFEERRTLIEYVDRFVKAHRQEPDFSFSISRYCPANYRFWETKFHPAIKPDPVLIEALYYPFMPKGDLPPKYILSCPDRPNNQ